MTEEDSRLYYKHKKVQLAVVRALKEEFGKSAELIDVEDMIIGEINQIGLNLIEKQK